MEAVRKSGFEYHIPGTVDEAVHLLSQYGVSAKLMAGGTDLIPRYKAGITTPGHIVSIRGIRELDYIKFDKEAGLRIGAAAVLHDIERHPDVLRYFPMLYQGVHSMASAQIRNAGTLVGNICNAVPSADTAPALLALDAMVRLAGPSGERLVPIDEFFTGVCSTVVREDELAVEVIVPMVPENAEMNYYKNTVRRALDLAIVGVGVCIMAQEGVCTHIRIGLGAVAATPRRAVHAEEFIMGRKLTRELVEKAAVIASVEDCLPISDIRATKEYRTELVRLSVRDGILAGMKE